MSGKIEDLEVDDGSIVVDLAEPEKKDAKPAAAADAGAKPAADAKNDDADGQAINITDLQKKLADQEAARAKDKQARFEAERRAQEAEAKVAKVETDLASSELDTLTTALDAAKTKMETLERELGEALESGDSKRVVKANKDLANATYDLQTLEDGRTRHEADIKARRDAAEDAAKNPQTRAVDPEDRVEATIASVKSPKAREFLREHKDWVADPKQFQRMVAYHNLAVVEGHAPDSDDYFNFIDKSMGAKVADKDREPEARAPRFAPNAPVSRAGQDAGSSSRVRLSAEQADMARAQGYTPAEYAKLMDKAAKLRGNDKGIIRFSRDQLN